MMLRMSCVRFSLIVAAVLYFCFNVLMLWYQIPLQAAQPCVCECSSTLTAEPSPCIPSETSNVIRTTERPSIVSPNKTLEEDWGPHTLAVVVPFRDRYEEVLEFAPHMHRFLNRQKVRHEFWVINQEDAHRFNRAKLLNAGFMLSRNHCDYFVMHDVDLLPMNDDIRYSYPASGPMHISSPKLHPLYHYATFVGGILMMTREQFEKVNGLSTLFWGWGREDDELYLRMKEAKMTINYPQGITTGYQTFRHVHDKKKRPRDQKKSKSQWEMAMKRDTSTGLNTMQYSVKSVVMLTIDEAPVNFVSVELHCDYDKTPFCDHQ